MARNDPPQKKGKHPENDETNGALNDALGKIKERFFLTDAGRRRTTADDFYSRTVRRVMMMLDFWCFGK